jgi:hypothetical protein
MNEPEATLAQRTALFNMYTALKKDRKGIRSMSKAEASIAIQEAKKEIEANGFPEE